MKIEQIKQIMAILTNALHVPAKVIWNAAIHASYITGIECLIWLVVIIPALIYLIKIFSKNAWNDDRYNAWRIKIFLSIIILILVIAALGFTCSAIDYFCNPQTNALSLIKAIIIG